MVIAGVQSATTEQTAPAAGAPSPGTGGADFADALKAASPKDKLEPVAGHAYSKVVSGPNKGMYVNTAGNERDGKLFELLDGEAHDHHVYGAGDEKLVFGVPGKPAPAATTAPAATPTSPAALASPVGTAPAPPAPALSSPAATIPVVTTPSVPLLPGPAAAEDDPATPADPVATPPVLGGTTPIATPAVDGATVASRR